jgi:hypothetical protein
MGSELTPRKEISNGTTRARLEYTIAISLNEKNTPKSLHQSTLTLTATLSMIQTAALEILDSAKLSIEFDADDHEKKTGQ